MVRPMDVEKQIRECIESFVADLDALTREAALLALTEAFGEVGGGRSGGRRGKRTSGQLEQLQQHLLETIESNPGLRVEALSDVMGIPTRELALPMRKLLAARAVKKKGRKRATCYFVR